MIACPGIIGRTRYVTDVVAIGKIFPILQETEARQATRVAVEQYEWLSPESISLLLPACMPSLYPCEARLAECSFEDAIPPVNNSFLFHHSCLLCICDSLNFLYCLCLANLFSPRQPVGLLSVAESISLRHCFFCLEVRSFLRRRNQSIALSSC